MERFRASSDEKAFHHLVSRYYRSALCVAVGILGRDGLTAEDAVQEAFVRVVRASGRFDTQRSFAPWFFSILRNVCLDLLRVNTRRRRFMKVWLAEQTDRPQPTASELDGASDLLALLQKEEREVLVYRVLHGMTFREIAALVGCSEEAAKKRAQRALRRLRQYLSTQSDEGQTADSQTKRLNSHPSPI